MMQLVSKVNKMAKASSIIEMNYKQINLHG